LNHRSPASKAGRDGQTPLHAGTGAHGRSRTCMLQLRFLCFVNTAGYVGEWYCQIGSRRTIRTCLPPLTAERLHRDGSAGIRWWSNGESNSGRRSCKDQLQPAACPKMVPSAGFEPASCALQARAITRFANWARALSSEDLPVRVKKTRQTRMARTSVIETESPEWHSGARPSSYVRMMVGNPGIEPGRRKGAGFTGPLSPQT
jgi:hypothetical protein